jgi:C1A family cysteine protease
MKSFFIASLFSVSFFTTLVNATIPFSERFENWVNRFRIHFENEEHMFSTFNKWIINDRFISVINNRNLTYKLAHNQFSGMNERDFQNYIMHNNFLFNRVPKTEFSYFNATQIQTIPTEVDWEIAGAVTPVKDQGQCGSCWSFSATGALEGAYRIKSGDLVSFSEQQLVDCDNLQNGGKDYGCNGGLMDNAFTWIAKNGGLCTEADYPYISGTGETQKCVAACSNVAGSQIAKYMDVVPGDDAAMMSAVALQPVSVAIEADQREFQLYSSGVFTETCGVNLDHGVLVVGYGNDASSGKDYYRVKNSWGESWGDNGYILLGRGKEYNNGKGQCGVLLEASFPIL